MVKNLKHFTDCILTNKTNVFYNSLILLMPGGLQIIRLAHQSDRTVNV